MPSKINLDSQEKIKNTISSPQKFYIETYGCQMNEYDSLIARNILEKKDAISTNVPNDADIILLNTCAIRENAHEKIYNRLQHFAPFQRKGAKIGILGCMAQNLKDDLLHKDLPIDFVMGPDSLRNLAYYVEEVNTAEQEYTTLSKTETYDDIIPNVEHHVKASTNIISASVSIQRGCDNFCSFCVVPYTRGRERSRDPKSIIQEMNNLVAANFKSITLLGQNVNSYNHDGIRFYDLIRTILKETNVERLYFTSPHPKDYPNELIDLMAVEPRFCNLIHIPLQAGSNEVLKRMKRDYTKEEFLTLADKMRTKVPDVCLTTDVIVGFPGETDENFQETYSVMEQAGFDAAFMFAYSERKQTLASKIYPDDIPEETKKERLSLIIEAQLKRSLKRNSQYIGKTIEAMVEGYSKQERKGHIGDEFYQLKGSMTNGRKIIFNSKQTLEELAGQVHKFTIKGSTSSTLFGDML